MVQKIEIFANEKWKVTHLRHNGRKRRRGGMKYEVKTKFVFSGKFIIEAENKEQAREFVEERCSLVIGGNIHSTLKQADWDFPVHPEKIIGQITWIPRRKT
jgi:hypothetical protein